MNGIAMVVVSSVLAAAAAPACGDAPADAVDLRRDAAGDWEMLIRFKGHSGAARRRVADDTRRLLTADSAVKAKCRTLDGSSVVLDISAVLWGNRTATPTSGGTAVVTSRQMACRGDVEQYYLLSSSRGGGWIVSREAGEVVAPTSRAGAELERLGRVFQRRESDSASLAAVRAAIANLGRSPTLQAAATGEIMRFAETSVAELASAMDVRRPLAVRRVAATGSPRWGTHPGAVTYWSPEVAVDLVGLVLEGVTGEDGQCHYSDRRSVIQVVDAEHAAEVERSRCVRFWNAYGAAGDL